MSTDDRDEPRWGERTPESQPSNQDRSAEPDAGSAGQHGYARPGAQDAYGQPDAQRHDAQKHDAQRHDAPQQYGQQQYGQQQQPHDQQQHGQQQYGQQPAQHPYGQPYGQQPTPGTAQAANGHPGHWNDGSPAKKSNRLGVIALVVGVVALALGIAGGVFFGNAIATLPGFQDALRGKTADPSAIQGSIDASTAGPLVLAMVLGGVGTLLGLWALVQGIIAAVKGRGRAAGIVAIILAVLGPIAFGVLYIVVAFSQAGFPTS